MQYFPGLDGSRRSGCSDPSIDVLSHAVPSGKRCKNQRSHVLHRKWPEEPTECGPEVSGGMGMKHALTGGENVQSVYAHKGNQAETSKEESARKQKTAQTVLRRHGGPRLTSRYPTDIDLLNRSGKTPGNKRWTISLAARTPYQAIKLPYSAKKARNHLKTGEKQERTRAKTAAGQFGEHLRYIELVSKTAAKAFVPGSRIMKRCFPAAQDRLAVIAVVLPPTNDVTTTTPHICEDRIV